MEGVARETLPYQGGYMSLTDSHLFVVRDGYVAESLLLLHLSDVTAENAHSFRHRVLGIVAAVVLLSPVVGVLLPDDIVGNIAVLALFRGRFGIGLLFAVFFGLYFLWGVLTSRRIWWAHVRYGGTLKLTP